MRRVTCVLALFLLAACGPISASSDAGADGAATPCDGKKDCNACQTCASQQQCISQVAACKQSSACQGVDGCVKMCNNDPTCKQECYSNNPDGLSTYVALINCLLCTQCPSDCAGYTSCS